MESTINPVKHISKAKKYSYDHLNIVNRAEMKEIIKKYENVKKFKHCFSEIVYRLNSWSNKKRKLMVVTPKYLYLFTTPTKLKKAIKLRKIRKIKHSQQNNYLGICVSKQEEEVIEIFKKEELILFLNRKLGKLGKNLKLIEETKFHKNNKRGSAHFNPLTEDKFRPNLLQTFSLASKNKDIGHIKIEHKEFFGMFESEQEMVGLLTKYGIIFFKSTNFELIEFIPLIGIKVKTKKENSTLTLSLTDKTNRVLGFNSVAERDSWNLKLSKMIRKNNRKPKS